MGWVIICSDVVTIVMAFIRHFRCTVVNAANDVKTDLWFSVTKVGLGGLCVCCLSVCSHLKSVLLLLLPVGTAWPCSELCLW